MFLFYVSMVLYFSAQPESGFSWFYQLWKYDKIVHFMEYLGMGFLLINALKIQPLKKRCSIFSAKSWVRFSGR